jgi:uncharacterized membrane protein YbaN (DUF454 family)
MVLIFRTAGTLLFMVGAVGVVVPVLPTTVFWIVAVLCFVKAGDPRAQRLLEHPRFGPAIRLFLERGAMSRRAKRTALLAMGGSAALLGTLAASNPAAAGIGWATLAAAVLYVALRPEPDSAAASADGRGGIAAESEAASARGGPPLAGPSCGRPAVRNGRARRPPSSSPPPRRGA